MNETTITVYHEESGEIRACGKETGAKGYYFALVTLADDMRRYGGDIKEYEIYEGMPGNGVMVQQLKPASDKLMNDLRKLMNHPY